MCFGTIVFAACAGISFRFPGITGRQRAEAPITRGHARHAAAPAEQAAAATQPAEQGESDDPRGR